MSRIIFHIDVNAAYLSWTAVEQLKKGAGVDLRTIPAIIGGDQKSRHGVVLAKSIPARQYGIRTGEPVAHALRKCPGLHVERPDHEMYRAYSKKLMDLLRTYTPDIEQVSVDECYMDYTGIAHLFYSPVSAAMEIKDKIYGTFGFTVNVGISSNKLLAKMASDFEKPNKVHTLFPEEIREKMWPLPIRELYMAGGSSEATLRKLGIRTIGELAAADPGILELHMKSHGRMLWNFANGIDETPVVSERAQAKGVGNSVTLAEDISSEEEACRVLMQLAQSVGGRLRKAGQKAGMVSVEIKYATFAACSHQKQLPGQTNSDTELYRAAAELFQELWSGEAVRLLGIRTSKLEEENAPVQMNLFDFGVKEADERETQRGTAVQVRKQEKLDQALDAIRKKYGEDAVVRGSLLEKEIRD